jgi:NADH:ubiquinone oxidoreductase subunit K
VLALLAVCVAFVLLGSTTLQAIGFTVGAIILLLAAGEGVGGPGTISDYRRKQEIFTREAETRRLRKGRD